MTTTIVIFGASGDLTRRKLVPALYSLRCKGRLVDDLRIVGFARRPYDSPRFRELMKDGVKEFAADRYTDAAWDGFQACLHYVQGDLGSEKDFRVLDGRLGALEGGPSNRLYYFSIAPRLYASTIELLGRCGMAQEADGYRRTIIEKPFGTDRCSAAALNAAVHDVFDERQVYRIDLRSGKALAEKVSEIVIQFRAPPHVMFPLPAGARLQSNYLAICVQPDEGMHLRLEAKVPDTIAELRAVDMEFHYDEGFDGLAIPDAYERLLLDALQGDPSLFARSDGIELSWKAIDPIIEGWRGPDAPRLETYAPGSWGPGGADALLRRDGRSWRRGCGQHGTHGTR